MNLQFTGETVDVFDALSNENRLKTLALVNQGKELQEIPEELGVSRSSVQNYLDALREADLLEKKGRGEYSLTQKGDIVLHMVQRLDTYFAMVMIPKLKQVLMNPGFDISEENRETIIEIMEEAETDPEKVMKPITEFELDQIQEDVE